MNTHAFLKKLMFCMMLLLPVTLSANTVVFGGYIAMVSVDGDPQKKVNPYIDVMRTWDGRNDDYAYRRVEITARCTCFLDGKKLDPKDFIKAVKPGMAIRAVHDLFYIRAYSDPGLLAASPDAVLGTDGALNIRLQQIGPMVCTRIGETVGRCDNRSPDFVLHLCLLGGKIQGAIAIVTAVGGPWQDVDVSGLTYQAGKVTGVVKSSVRFAGRTINGKPAMDCVFNLDVSVAKDGTATGTYSGTVDVKKVTGKTIGQAQPARDVSGNLGVWVRLEYDAASDDDHLSAGRWTFARKNGKFVGGGASVTHGYLTGQVDSGTFQVDGNSFKADFACHAQDERTKYSFSLKGQIVGDIVYGTFTDPTGKTGRCRGEIRRPDAPAVWGWSESKLKKQIAAGEYPE